MKADTPVIDTSNINEKIYNYLKEQIIGCKYPPGERINMEALRKLFGVSQTPLKEALFRLAGEGFVEVNARRGTFVKNITEQDVVDIFETRSILETSAAERVVGNLTDEQIGRFEKLYQLTLHRDEDVDYREFLRRSNNFHTEIIRLTGNKRLLAIYKTLNGHMHLLRFRYIHHASQRLPGTDDEHLSILKAFQERDPQKAKQAIQYHLEMAKKLFIKTSVSD